MSGLVSTFVRRQLKITRTELYGNDTINNERLIIIILFFIFRHSVELSMKRNIIAKY